MDKLQKYIDDRFVFNVNQGPRDVPDIELALETGINCITLAHLAVHSLFVYRLPQNLHFYELFTDTTHFDEVDDISKGEIGDLIWFGPNDPNLSTDNFIPLYRGDELINWRDYPVRHVGVLQSFSEQGEAQILHATKFAGTNVIWPLGQFQDYDRYQRIYGMRRLRPEYRG